MRKNILFLNFLFLISCNSSKMEEIIKENQKLKHENNILFEELETRKQATSELKKEIETLEKPTGLSLQRFENGSRDNFLFFEGDSMFPFGYIKTTGYIETVEVFHPVDEIMIEKTVFIFVDKNSPVFKLFSSDPFKNKGAFVYRRNGKIGLFIDLNEISGGLRKELSLSSLFNPVEIRVFLKETILGGISDYWPYLLPISIEK